MKKVNYEGIVYGECSEEVKEQLKKCQELEYRGPNEWVIITKTKFHEDSTYRGTLKETKRVPWEPHRFIGKVFRGHGTCGWENYKRIGDSFNSILFITWVDFEDMMDWQWLDSEGNTGYCCDEVDE